MKRLKNLFKSQKKEKGIDYKKLIIDNLTKVHNRTGATYYIGDGLYTAVDLIELLNENEDDEEMISDIIWVTLQQNSPFNKLTPTDLDVKGKIDMGSVIFRDVSEFLRFTKVDSPESNLESEMLKRVLTKGLLYYQKKCGCFGCEALRVVANINEMSKTPTYICNQLGICIADLAEDGEPLRVCEDLDCFGGLSNDDGPVPFLV